MKRHIIFLLIGIVMLVFGCSYLWFEVMSLNFINEEPKHELVSRKEVYEFPITSDGNYHFLGDNVSFVLKTSDELENTIKVEATFYQEFGVVNYIEKSYYGTTPVKSVIFYQEELQNLKNFKSIYMMLLDDLRDKTIHNYNLLFRPVVVVTLPEELQDRVMITEDDDEFLEFFQGEELDD